MIHVQRRTGYLNAQDAEDNEEGAANEDDVPDGSQWRE